jgi:hypothetical protein
VQNACGSKVVFSSSTASRLKKLPFMAARTDNQSSMGKLQPQEVVKYLDTHVPYRLGILLAHYRMTRRPWRGDQAILDACFVASLVTARMFLNMLGIDKDKNGLMCFSPMKTDVCVDDLGGVLIDPATLAAAEQKLCINFPKDGRSGSRALYNPDHT